MARNPERSDDGVAGLTDLELVQRFRRLRSLVREDHARRGEAISRAEAEFLARPTPETLAAVRAARQDADAPHSEIRGLDGEMARRLGMMLKAARLARGLTVSDLARHDGRYHSSTIAGIERGRSLPTDPDFYERACTEGELDPTDAALRHSFWFPLLDHPQCRTIRTVAVDRNWLTHDRGAVGDMARSIASARSFDLLPILADALEEAGCADDDILTHCREPAEHARGCWVIDALVRAGRRPGSSPGGP